MIEPELLQSFDDSQLLAYEHASKELLQKLTKTQIYSIKSMIMPPLFTFNVLKLVLLLHKPEICLTQQKISEINWNTIRNDLLKRPDIFKRKCESICLIGLEQEVIEALQQIFQDTYKSFGNNLLGKAQLYGNFVSTMCNWTIKIRTIMHAYSNMRTQD